MARPQWADFGGIWKTIREMDVNAIRHEAERGVSILCVGQQVPLWHLDRLLRDGPNRYPLSPDPLALVPLADVARYLDDARSADVLILALGATPSMSAADLEGLRQLAVAPRPTQVVLLFGEAPGGPAPPGGPGWDPAALASTAWAPYLDARLATYVDAADPGAGLKLCGAVMDALPPAARLAAARRLPGLRPLFAARLTGEVSVSNATVALASGVPSLVPFLGIPLSAADTIILTKNEALMVYRLALACGAPPEFQRRMIEITPVVGGAVVWRQIAGALAGLVPGYGLVPKTAVAFGGTYVVGLLATRWYETGFLSDEDRRRITAEAATRAREAATLMVAQARAAGDKAGAQTRTGMKKVSRGAAAAGAKAQATAQKTRAGAQKATQTAKDRTRSGIRRVLRRQDPVTTDPAAPDTVATDPAADETGAEASGPPASAPGSRT